MQALGSQLEITESIIASGVQIFKIAAMNNFIQGRCSLLVQRLP
jgi:transcription factor IIIB subunit 2